MEQSKIDFFKNKVKQRFKELKPYMSDIKYRLYMRIIDNCNTFEDISCAASHDNAWAFLCDLRDDLGLGCKHLFKHIQFITAAELQCQM